jgi:hypothetical protein
MSKLLAAFVVAFLLVAAPAHAALFTLASYSVDVRTEDPGLVLFEKTLYSNPLSFALNNVGESVTFALFEIGTKETALNLDDLIPYKIEVDFNFSSPAPGFGGEANGLTGAGWLLDSFGYVAWDNPFELKFGNYGLLGITMENAKFDLPGSTKIDATFTLLRADGGQPTTVVPEPTSALLLGLGVVAVSVVRRRRQPVAK